MFLRSWLLVPESLRTIAFFGLTLVGCGSDSRTTTPAADGRQTPTSIATETLGSTGVSTNPAIVSWGRVNELPSEIAVFESVFWEPADTISLRRRILSDPSVKGANVLEIGTGSGLISLCCLSAGAARVIGTDLNPAAVRNSLHNAKEFGYAERFESRLVPRRSPGAWTVIEPKETFDLIISNPPWEDGKPVRVDEFALYDPDFELLKSLVTGARERLRPNGKLWLAYGCVAAIRKIQEVAAAEGLHCTLLDERPIESLPELFLPGMLIEITVLPEVSFPTGGVKSICQPGTMTGYSSR